MKKEESLDYTIKICWHAISRMYNVQAAKHDFTAAIGYVLLNIDPEHGTPATKIAPQLGLEARSLTRLLKSMEEKNYLCKVPDPVDKRMVRIFLTELGLKKREISRQTVLQFNKRMQEIIPQNDLQVFFKVIGQIQTAIENKVIFK